MSSQGLVSEMVKGMRSLSEACELLGQERAINAVLDHLEVRGAAEDELRLFEKAIRERLKFQQ